MFVEIKIRTHVNQAQIDNIKKLRGDNCEIEVECLDFWATGRRKLNQHHNDTEEE